ncbi:sialate O-acetylesterase [Pseudooceanicola atlanticus]|uniref:Sialate O-acetylesterase domain-containing protein n=1 Tax=Pseudooceanicola atlanticus TaxID=1461694 RepID=A0A0A0EKH7_9RHOB|nr:sialate O-acetylesterase [Pseudooceanicola atlanticus]KGM50673.1 hypothetical protein ATO9_04165 [Pseudooceanicola atlanticus]
MATAPVFSLSTTGGVPKIASKGNLEAGINSGFATLQSRIDALSIAATLGFPTFDSTAEGIAGVADGETFSVVGENLVDLYRRSGASATAVAAIPQLDAAIKGVTEQGWKSRGTTEPSHANYKVQIGSTWYSPDWLTVLVTGQSNPKGNSAATNGDKTGAGDVWVWNGYTAGTTGAAVEVAGDAIVEAALGAVPFTTAEGTVNNMAFHAAHRMSVALRRPVLIVMTAVGGTGINDWDPSSGGFWSAMDTAITDALADGDLWGTEKVDLFMMGWGEDAYNLTTNMWTLGDSRLPEIITAAKAASWASEDIFFAATLPVQEADGGDAWQVSREWIKIAASGKYANFAVVPSDGLALTGEDVGLQVHFDGASLQELGYRTADIFLGKSAGVTSDSSYPRGLPNTETFRAQPMVLLGEMLFDPTDPDDDGGDPDEVQVASGANGIPVLYVKDDGGTITRDGGTTTGGSPSYSHTVDSTNRVRLRAYAAAAAARDNPVRLNIGAGEPAGENSLTSLVIPPDAPLSQIYLTGPTNLKGRVIAADIPRTVETLRLQDAPGLDFSDFIAEDMPPGLTYLNLTGCLVPNNVKAAIDAENIARGGMITVVHGEEAGFTETRTFTSVTEMTNAITDGFSQLDGRVAFISNPTTGAFTTLQAKAGVAATPGEAPAGWQIVNRSGGFLARSELEDFIAAGGVFANGVVSDAGDLRFLWDKARTLTLTGSVTVATGETLTQATSGATGIVKEGGTGSSFVVTSVVGDFDTSNELTGSLSGALGANSVPSVVAVYAFISGMPGVKPVAPSTPDHFADNNTPGTTNMRTALVEWAADTSVLKKELRSNTIYAASDLVSAGASLAFPAGSVVDGNGATIQFSETDTSNNQRGILGNGGVIENLNFRWTDNGGSGHYFERFLALKVGTRLRHVKFSADTDQPASVDDSGYDTCVRFDGTDIELECVEWDGIYQCADGWAGGSPSDIRILNCKLRRYASGISLQGIEKFHLNGLTVYSKNANATPDPGKNAITGGTADMVVKNVVIEDSGEHAIYLSTSGSFAAPVYGLTMDNIRVRGSGQCAVKLRGWGDVVLRNVYGANAHNASAAGINEDGLRLEECVGVRVFNFGHGNDDGSGNGGYDLIHIDSCAELDFYGSHLADAQRAGVYITDTRVSNSISGIRFNGVSFLNMGNKPLFQIVCGDLPDKALQITGLHSTDGSGNLVAINATGTVGANPVEIQGKFLTSGSLMTNTSGGGGVLMDLDQYYVGGGLPTVASLANIPANAGFRKAVVTDANATAFASTVAGGGANTVPVYFDGTNWLIG